MVSYSCYHKVVVVFMINKCNLFIQVSELSGIITIWRSFKSVKNQGILNCVLISKKTIFVIFLAIQSDKVIPELNRKKLPANRLVPSCDMILLFLSLLLLKKKNLFIFGSLSLKIHHVTIPVKCRHIERSMRNVY